MAGPSRDRVFAQPERVSYLFANGFVDLYALMEIPREASSAQVEEAIVAVGAGLLTLLFARGGTNSLQETRRSYLPHLRSLLLQPAARLEYDDALHNHDRGFMAPSLDELIERHKTSTTARLRQAQGAFWRQMARRLHESEYL